MLPFDRINLVSVFLIGVFLLPIAIGIFRPLTSDRIHSSLYATFSALAVIASAALAFLCVDCLFSNGGNNPLARLFHGVPAFWLSIAGQDIFVYLLIFLVLFIGLNGAFQLLLIPLNRHVLYPLSQRLGHTVGSMRRALGRLVGGLWQLPKSIWLVLVFALFLNFYALVSSNKSLEDYIRSSAAFRLVDSAAVQPLISSEAARQIPAVVNSTVDKAVQCLSPEGRKLLIKVYINGITVEDAVKSSPEIDALAVELVRDQVGGMEKAALLYDWVSQSISYDRDKAERLETDAFGSPSGAVVAFNEKTGVCFDKACLYATMCRAVGVRVRLITGLASNGADWLDHSWNEIYDESGSRWVDVDTTFGRQNRDYFDSPVFNEDHRDREVQGEW